jgi:hypothetical protein
MFIISQSHATDSYSERTAHNGLAVMILYPFGVEGIQEPNDEEWV